MTRWFFTPRLVRDPRFRLFLFHWAGGGATAYRRWPEHFPAHVSVSAVQLPGREDRLREAAFERMEPMLDALTAAITPLLDVPFAFFGHSLGGLVAFELTRRLRRQGLPMPKHLVVSGRRAPKAPVVPPPVPTYQLSMEGLQAFVERLGGTPRAVMESTELRDLYLRILRSDFALLDTHAPPPEEPLDIPLTAFCADADSQASVAEMEYWREESRGRFELRTFSGNHFFLLDNDAGVPAALRGVLWKLLTEQE
jgi:medium-chain acyl-[acyl-carrier-protein] hydrolase